MYMPEYRNVLYIFKTKEKYNEVKSVEVIFEDTLINSDFKIIRK